MPKINGRHNPPANNNTHQPKAQQTTPKKRKVTSPSSSSSSSSSSSTPTNKTTNKSNDKKSKKKNKRNNGQNHNHNHIHNKIEIFGINIPRQYLIQYPVYFFLVLATIKLFFSLVFAFLQEFVFSVPGYKYPKFMTLVQTLTYTVCAFVEILVCSSNNPTSNTILGKFIPRAPFHNYIVLSFLTFGGMYFTNVGFKILNSYPTRIIIKGAKPIPTMLIEYVYVGKSFMRLEIFSVFVITLGIICFCSGEVNDSPSFNTVGVAFMLVGVLCDSLTSNFEKKKIFEYGSSHTEAMLYASIFGFLWCLVTEYTTDRGQALLDAIDFVFFGNADGYYALLWLVLSSISGYLSVCFILLLIKLFSTTYAECVKGLRKVLSIALSYLFLSAGKTFNVMHALGILCFVVSMLITIYSKSQKKKKTHPKKNSSKHKSGKNSKPKKNAKGNDNHKGKVKTK